MKFEPGKLNYYLFIEPLSKQNLKPFQTESKTADKIKNGRKEIKSGQFVEKKIQNPVKSGKITHYRPARFSIPTVQTHFMLLQQQAT